MTKIQLPLFEDKLTLPTGKHHVSYSEINDHLECSYRHKLKHVDKIKLNGANIHSIFGSTVHDAIENYLLTKKAFDCEEILDNFKKNIKELDKIPPEEELEPFYVCLPDILSQFPGWLNHEFPNHKVIAAELQLFEGIKNQPGVNLKGYIDIIIKVPKKRGKGEEYYIIDAKTTSWGWSADQKRSFNKQLQLMLYKNFFCQLMNIPFDQVKCAFLLMKRVAPKNRKPYDRLELVPISIGPKAIEKAQEILSDTINKIRKGYTLKNRMSCLPFCEYYGTIHCK